MNVAQIDAALRLVITAVQAAQAMGVNFDEVSRKISQAQSEGRDLTEDDLVELRVSVQSKIDAL